MKWSRHARKVFGWHYRLEFAVSSLWKTLGREYCSCSCSHPYLSALVWTFAHWPWNWIIFGYRQQHLPTYLFNHRISAVARTRNSRARAIIKNNFKIHILLHYTERSWKTWELSLDTLENKAAFEKTTYLQNICR